MRSLPGRSAQSRRDRRQLALATVRVTVFRGLLGAATGTEDALMDKGVADKIDAIEADQRPLFDRVHRWIMEVQPDVEMVLSCKMPTFVSGARRLHVGVWKHGLSRSTAGSGVGTRRW